MKRLPPLRLLMAFEEVSRRGSMRAAAISLNVTQPAVSQSIQALEDHIGVPLFDRSCRPARLNEFGLRLAQATRDGMGQIAAAIEDIRSRSGHMEGQVTVACTLGMATYWLMPRLPDFYARHPGITVNVQAPASDMPVLTPDIDLALRYGPTEPASQTVTPLFAERICPVGTPAFLKRLPPQSELSALPLIHVRSAHNLHWAGWVDYLRIRDLPRAKAAGISFDNYVQAVQEALSGRGLMLGWRSITGGLVAEGALTEWPHGACDLGTSYHLIEASAPSENARILARWLQAECALVS